jgi:hypothetical protein
MSWKEIVNELNRKKQDYINSINRATIVKATSVVLALGVLIGIASKAGESYFINTDDAVNDDNNISYVEPGEIQTPEIIKDLEFVNLMTDASGKLTSDSVKNLTQSTIKEIEEIYSYYGSTMAPVLEWQRLASLFYVENTCRPVDPKNDNFVGIGQIGVNATTMAIKRANKLYNKAVNNGMDVNIDNYIAKYMVCNGSEKEIADFAYSVWEEAKTNPSICSMVSALYLDDLSARYYSAYGENPDAIIMMYNAGEGNFKNFMTNGVVELSQDKKTMTVDLSQVDSLSDRQLVSWNEAITYLIRVNGGYALVKNDPNADLLEIFEMHRRNVGKNNNQLNGSYNDQQYNYVPDSVVVKDKYGDNVKIQ